MSRRKQDTETEIITYFEEKPLDVAVMLLKIVRGCVERRQRASEAERLSNVRTNKALQILTLAMLAMLAAPLAHGQSAVDLFRALKAFSAPVMHVEYVALAACPPATVLGPSPCTVVPPGSTTFPYTLKAPPIASMGALFYFTSSQLGGDVFTPLSAIQPTVVFTLPTYAPSPACPSPAVCVPVDVTTITYWSTI